MKHIDAIPFQNVVDGEEFREAREFDSYSYSNSNGFDLADFLNQTSETGVGGDVIDPLGLFDIELRFFPTQAHQSQNTFLYDLLQTTYFSWANKPKQSALLQDQLCLQLGLYVQSMNIPQMVMPNTQTTPTLFGEFPTNSLYVKPQDNTFTMTILNTKISLHDYVFYPWMREAVSPKWAYDEQPYTTANIYVSFAKHSNVQYVFTGARPSQVASRQPTQEPGGEATRDVTMLFDYMFILPATTMGHTAFSYANSNAYKNLEKNGGSPFEGLS